MKLQTAANKENNFDLEEDEDQGESEDYDGEGFISQSRLTYNQTNQSQDWGIQPTLSAGKRVLSTDYSLQ